MNRESGPTPDPIDAPSLPIALQCMVYYDGIVMFMSRRCLAFMRGREVDAVHVVSDSTTATPGILHAG